MSVTFDPFYSAKLRIARAEEHLDDLEAKIDKYFGKNPYAIVRETDADEAYEILKVQFTERLPFRWRILATEIVEHLRASLDHATWACSYLKTGDPNTKFVSFPFGKTARDVDNGVRARAKHLPPEIQSLLKSFKPHKGGNDALCTLNDLCNTSKHALVAFVAGATAGFEIQGFGLDRPIELFDPLIWDHERNEIKFARVERGFDFKHNAKLRVFIALQHKEETSPVSAVAIFHAMILETTRVILKIEAECRRLGLVV